MHAARLALALTLLAAPGLALAQTAAPLAAPLAADEAVATASKAVAPATSPALPVAVAPSRPMTTQEQVDAWLAPPQAVDPAYRDEDAPNREPRQVHGMVSATIGTGGYRSAYVSTVIPLGETATLGLAVGQTDYGNTARYIDGYGAGYGYDQGPYAGVIGGGRHAGRLARGGKSQSVAISLAFGQERDAGDSDCAPGFRVDGRYVEPLWVAGMRDKRLVCDTVSQTPSR